MTKITLPKISIITPSYNQGEFLEECIDSILSQNYPNLEYIIMDGGSTDNSVEIIKKYEKYLTYWQSQPDNGQYAAVNDGFKKTTGEIMTWLNSDDKYHPNAFLKVAYIFNTFSHIEWLSGRPTIWDKNGNLVSIEDLRGGWSREKYLQKHYDSPFIQQETVFWRRSLWDRAGGHLRTDIALAGDLELWMRFFRLAQLYPVEALIGGYRRYGDQRAQLFLDKYIAEAERILDEEIASHKKGTDKRLLPPPPIVNINVSEFLSANVINDPDKIRQKNCWRGYIGNLKDVLQDAALKQKTDIIALMNNELDLLKPKKQKVPKKRVTEKTLPKISVITPSFNQGEFLEKTITSVLEQNYPDLEYIIIDGGSTDNSVDIIKKYEKYLTYWVSEKDRGQADAINKGFKRAAGDILAWLNSDDFYYPNAFNYIVQAFRKFPDAGLYIGNGYITDKEGKVLHSYSNGVGFDVDVLINGQCYILQPSVFINRTAFDKIGYLDESLHYEMDVDYWIRTGREFDVVVMNEHLSAYRWYEDVKTRTGAFKRWAEAYTIRRRYTDKEITPGLLVEFFLTLKNDSVLKDLGIDFQESASKLHNLTYNLTQKALGLKDNIPAGKGILFVPDKKEQAAVRAEKFSAPAFVHTSDSKPKIDIVLQATGSHAWGVGGGWINGANKLGLLNRVFAPKANWGDPEVLSDDGLWSYLADPQADIMLLLGFDWHSQMLHSSPRWRERWLNSKILKILYVQESVENNCRLFENDLMRQAVISAMKCADAIVYTDITDETFFQNSGMPSLWQPFGVDDVVFNNKKAFQTRIARPFFRGKVTPFYTNKTYEERRELIQFLSEKNLIDLLPYKDKPVTPEEIAADFNDYQICINFPSLFSNHPTRVYEALACGCALITNLTGIPKVDDLFGHKEHLMYYSNREELLYAISLLSTDKDFSERLAKTGHEYALSRFTIDKHLLEVITWVEANGFPVASRIQKSDEIHRQSADIKIDLSSVLPGKKKGKILIDGIIFQLQKDRPAGISRVWKSLLQELAKSNLADDILLLDRDSTAPSIPGIARKPIEGCDFTDFADNSLYLEDICRSENSALFISTYFTYPENSHSALMLHDMTPEIKGLDMTLPEYRSKPKALEKANAYFTVSQSTANDFRMLHPQHKNKKIFLVPNAVTDNFKINSDSDIRDFKEKYDVRKPYFLFIGHRTEYKNGTLFFRAFSLLENKNQYEILCLGGRPELEPIFAPYVRNVRCRVLYLSDYDLSIAYSGAIALVYPSKYEGFGLPILEANKSGCPVITCRNSSIPEVSGDAVLYVNEIDVAGMRDALMKVQQPEVRDSLIEKGLENAKRFSWARTGIQLTNAIQEIMNDLKGIPLNRTDPMDTPSRLIYALEKFRGWTDLSIVMYNLEQMYTKAVDYNFSALKRSESFIANMPQDIFDLINDSLPLIEVKNAFFYYYWALALEKRNLLPEALEAFSVANKNWKADYKWRPAYLAGDVALRMGKLDLAQRFLRETAHGENPDKHEAKKKLRLIEKRQKQPSAGRKGETVPLGTITTDKFSESEIIKDIPGHIQHTPIRVSAIVSVYNSEKFIRGCLEDLVNQTLYEKGDLEIIVVDSGSEQNEKAVVKEFQGRYSNISYVRTERETIYAAWNRGIKLAKGLYITNANTDDRHRKDSLEVMARTLDENPDAALVYGDAVITAVENETFEDCTPKGYFQLPEYDRKCLLHRSCIGPQPMWRKSLHDELGYFREDLKVAGDYEWWLRISEKYPLKHIPELLGLYYWNPKGMEHSHQDKSYDESSDVQKSYMEKAGINPREDLYPENFIVMEYGRKGKTDRIISPKPSFAAVYCVYDDITWLRDSLESIYYAVDAVYFLISDRPWYGDPADNTETLDRIKAFPDPHKKITVVQGTWRNETEQRNAGLDILKDKGIVYCFVIDSDEIYDPAELHHMMDLISQHPEIDCWHISLDTYWKSFRYRIEPREPLKPPVFVRTDNVRFLENRLAGGKKHAELPPETGICHHLSYAHDDAAVLKKITTFSHAPEVKPGWFENVWKKWDSDHSLTDLHPTHPACYQRAVEQPYSELPPVLKRYYRTEPDWAGDVVQDLTSIVILTFNEVSYTKKCLRSIQKHTPEPHEIIFVDNGSKDSTVKWLRKLIQENPHYKLIENERNFGFAKGCNQGILASSGEYILLLNNDVVVTDGWLSGMLECLKSASDTGIVGPMTNNVVGIQKLENIGYSSVEYLADFAKSFREKNRYRRIPSERLVGFCMLFKRSLMEKIGLLDERFGSGNYEDDDYCLRSSLEGHRNLIAGDVFIHHYGSRSFAGNRIDHRSAMAKNRKLFSDKWRHIDQDSLTGKRYLALNMLNSADQLYQRGQEENAAGVLLDGIRRNADDQRLHYALADIYMKSRKFAEALKILEGMPESLRENAQWSGYLAFCKIGLQLNDEAVIAADKALSLNAVSPLALNVKGLVALNKGLLAEAEDYYKKALESDGGFALTYLNMAALKWQSNDREEALRLYEKAFILCPFVSDMAMSYYSAALSLSRLEKTESLLKEASALYPANIKLRYILISMLMRMERYADAMKMLEEVMILFGIDENTLAAALELRAKIGPMEIDKASPDPISLCMIVKNEQSSIGHALWKIKPAVDEMIVVDTGSLDRTKDIAKAFGARIYDFAWTDDFAEARNFSLSKASGRWILILDADEAISFSDHDALRELVKKARSRHEACSFVTRNYVDSINTMQWTANDGTYGTEERGSGWFPGEKVRLFPNDSRVRFEYPVHERVEPSLVRAGIKIVNCSIPIHHYGTLDRGTAGTKAESYYELARKKVDEQTRPDEKALHELAVQAAEIGKYEEALEHLEKAVAVNPGFAPAYQSIGNNYYNLSRYGEALTAYKRAMQLDPDMRDSVLMRGTLEIVTGSIEDAIHYLKELISKNPGYLPAIAALVTAYFCLERKEEGMALLASLKKMRFDFAEYAAGMSRILKQANRPDYAIALQNALQ
jgi:glycosyltransferase involved in cell wall biosynthesis